MARSREQDTNVRTHASASKGSAKPCGWEMSSGPGLITYRGLAFIGGGTLWPLSRWSHSHFSEEQHNPCHSLLPRLPDQHKELHAARMPGASAEDTQTCTLRTPDNSVTFAVLAGR